MDIKLINDINRNGFDIYKMDNNPEKKIKSVENIDDEERKKDLNKAIKEINKYLEKENAYAKYDVHESFGDIMIQIVDKETKKIILEVPPKKILDMIAKLCEEAGVIVNKKV